MNTFSVDGVASDTVGFGGASLFASGIPANTDEVAYTITIGPLSNADHGKTICLDSSWYEPTGVWKWAGPDATPSWDGPHCFTVVDEASDVVADGNGLPTSFSLSQNYPNPFNPTTNISFDLPKKSDVVLTIYNVTGQKVTEISDSYDAGSHTINWDASNNASGIYFYKLNAGDFTDTKKMMLIK
ncbi:MAG: T9SS C-terminal target domain-containing protein [Calditrichaeota bacterium]|nr:MAG: T9SS C-terminal target domain-containing protein [Calditrichota bacterium]